jgi:hypothetical protein
VLLSDKTGPFGTKKVEGSHVSGQHSTFATVLRNLVFSNRWAYRLPRHLLYWLAWLLLLTGVYGTRYALTYPVADYGISRTYVLAFWENVPSTLLIGLITYVLLYWALPRFSPRQQWWPLAGVVLALVGAFVLVEGWFTLHLYNPLRESLECAVNNDALPHFFAFTNLLKHGSGMLGVAAAIQLFKQNWREREINLHLRRRQLETELELLRMQLHPHFLFNTLNNLYGQIMEGHNSAAADSVVRLSGLLRYMLYDCNTPHVPLARELAELESYVRLEQLRCHDRLDLAWSVQGNLAGHQIAPLLLWPLVENTFKHGLSEAVEGGWINADIQVRDHTLHFWLANSKTPDAPHPTAPRGLGLENVKRRLDLLYPDHYRLKINDLEDSFTVNLEITLG